MNKERQSPWLITRSLDYMAVLTLFLQSPQFTRYFNHSCDPNVRYFFIH